MQLAEAQTFLQGQLNALDLSKCTCDSRCLGANGNVDLTAGILLQPGVAEGLGPKHCVGCLLLRAAQGRSGGEYQSKPLSTRQSLQASNILNHSGQPFRGASGPLLSKIQCYSPGSFAGARSRGDALGGRAPIRDVFIAMLKKQCATFGAAHPMRRQRAVVSQELLTSFRVSLSL